MLSQGGRGGGGGGGRADPGNIPPRTDRSGGPYLQKDKTRGPSLKSPETLRAIFGCNNSLCISRTERI